MKITAPLSSPDEARRLAEAGADELYCGVQDLAETPGFFPNARSGPRSNLPSFRALEETLAEAGSLGLPVLFCANAPQGPAQTQLLKRDVLRACRAGVAGVILADPALLPWASASVPGTLLVASTLAGTLNRRTLGFLAGLGARRVVLDRQLAPAETAALAAHGRGLGVDTEVFVNDLMCLNVNGLCHFHQWAWRRRSAGAAAEPPDHAPCRALCAAAWEGPSAPPGRPAGSAPDRSGANCAFCALPSYHAAGVPYAKVIGRHLPTALKAGLVAATRDFLRRIAAGAGAEEGPLFYRKAYGEECGGTRCFHRDCHAGRREAAGGG